MFANFIYFILALLIYTTFQPTDQTRFSPEETGVLFAGLLFVYYLLTKQQFNRLERRAPFSSPNVLDQRFSAATNRLSVMAIVFFAFDIYGLTLSSYLSGNALFQAIPTLEALLFMALFMGYLCILWINAHHAYRAIYRSSIDKKTYVLSNIGLGVPVLLPWFVLSGMADLILALPFEWLRQTMRSPEGEIAYFLFFLFAVAVFGPLMIQKFWRCRPLEPGFMRTRIETLCRRADLSYADILYWPIFGGRMITAGVMGLVGRFRYILVTDALLQLLDPAEVDTVIAHEVGHVKKKHLLFYLVFFIGYMVIAYATFDLIVYVIIFSEPVYRFLFVTGIDRTTVITGLLSLAIIVNFLIYFRFLFGYFMRNFERQADAFVYTLFDSARPLINTFRKIVAVSGQSPEKPNWHHYSIGERVAFLLRCEQDRSWIKRHDSKVHTSILVFAATLVLVGIVGYQLNFGQTGRRLNSSFFETAIKNEISRNEGDRAALYGMLGDLYFERTSYAQAAAAYQKGLALASENAILLNNYAWLLVTCEDETIRDVRLALRLAQKAAAAESSPHIMDTLAEALYANGRVDEAVVAAKAALESAKTNRAYYKEQLQRFQAALMEESP